MAEPLGCGPSDCGFDSRPSPQRMMEGEIICPDTRNVQDYKAANQEG